MEREKVRRRASSKRSVTTRLIAVGATTLELVLGTAWVISLFNRHNLDLSGAGGRFAYVIADGGILTLAYSEVGAPTRADYGSSSTP